MNPGTYYLYQYEKNRRVKNVGFMKAVSRPQALELQIQARGIPASRTSPELCAFYQDGERLLSFPLGNLTCPRRMISARITLEQSQMPDGIRLEQAEGFLIWMPESGQSEQLLWAASEKELPPKFSISPYTGPEQEEEPEILSQSSSSDPLPEDPAVPCARKLRHSDLASLPQRLWPLANNSFLLHGYHNYNHLLLAEENGHMWLGVPGTYDPKEARVADLFGFPQFTGSYVSLLDLSESERADQENFGHWCRCIGKQDSFFSN